MINILKVKYWRIKIFLNNNKRLLEKFGWS